MPLILSNCQFITQAIKSDKHTGSRKNYKITTFCSCAYTNPVGKFHCTTVKPLFISVMTLKTVSSSYIKLFFSALDRTQLQFGHRWLEPSTWGKNRALLSHVALKTHALEHCNCQTSFSNCQKRWFTVAASEAFSMRCFKHLSSVETSSHFITQASPQGKGFIPKFDICLKNCNIWMSNIYIDCLNNKILTLNSI